MAADRPAEIFSPGDHLREELEARGWSQADLAEILGRPPRLVSEIITAKRSITPETAQGLGEALGTGAEYWMNLDSVYQLSLSRVANGAISMRAKIFGQFPVKEMMKRGWVRPSSNLAEIERLLLDYFRIPSLDDAVKIPHVAKKTSYEKTSMLQVAWLQRAKQLASSVAVQPYAHSRLGSVLSELRGCVRNPEDAAVVPGRLAAAGIRFLAIEALPGSKIDAACLWFESQPLVVLSLRYDRHDIFWHALLHELDHIEHGEGKDDPIVDSDMMTKCSAGLQSEQRANKAAASRLIPEHEMEKFIAKWGPHFSGQAILRFAAELDVHPGIAVGQLQHHGLVAWSSLNSFKAKIREYIVPSATSDGFERLAR